MTIRANFTERPVDKRPIPQYLRLMIKHVGPTNRWDLVSRDDYHRATSIVVAQRRLHTRAVREDRLVVVEQEDLLESDAKAVATWAQRMENPRGEEVLSRASQFGDEAVRFDRIAAVGLADLDVGN